MLSLAFLTAVLPLLALSAPTKRAGGPIAQPLPANCTITNPFPDNLPAPGLGFKPSPTFEAANLVYSFIFPPGGGSEDVLQGTCMEQCYGFGIPGEGCVANFVAVNVTTVEYGTDVTGVICQMFGAPFTNEDFVKPDVEGTWTAPKAVNQACPQ